MRHSLGAPPECLGKRSREDAMEEEDHGSRTPKGPGHEAYLVFSKSYVIRSKSLKFNILVNLPAPKAAVIVIHEFLRSHCAHCNYLFLFL